ncbi:MAG: SUMF1/EgtB/PvdO family nonheme iron enzyme [Planctomycetota bacterium]
MKRARDGGTVPSGRRPRGANRVIRGGSWNSNNTAANCRSANRNNNTPGNTNNNNGFRVVLAPALTDAADGWVDENRRPVQVGGGDAAGRRDGIVAGAGRGGGCRRRTPRPRRLRLVARQQ